MQIQQMQLSDHSNLVKWLPVVTSERGVRNILNENKNKQTLNLSETPCFRRNDRKAFRKYKLALSLLNFKNLVNCLPDNSLDLDPGVELAERLLQVLPEVDGHLHLRHGDVLESQVFVAVLLSNHRHVLRETGDPARLFAQLSGR
jgi:hypothetical protein